jgi:hypothetical protein
MAYEVNLRGRVVDKASIGLSGLNVALKQLLEVDNIRGTRTYGTTTNKTSDGNGYVLYSGISANTYDAIVTHPSGTFSLYNIIVKNEYPVVPGSTEALFEQRSYIRSQETIGPSGIMTSAEQPPIWIRTGNINYAPAAESGSNAGYVTNVWEDRIDGTLFSGTIQMQKELGDRAFHSNQSTLQVSSFTLKLLI